MPTIFSLADLQSDIDLALIESEGEVTPAIQAVLDAHATLEADKVDAYGVVIRDHLDRAASCEKLAKELMARAKQHKNIAEGRRRLMHWYLGRRGMQVLEGAFARFSVVKNGGAQQVVLTVPESDVPDAYRKPIPPQPERGEVDTNALRTALLAGDEGAAALATLAPRGERCDLSFGPRQRKASTPEATVNLAVLDGDPATAIAA